MGELKIRGKKGNVNVTLGPVEDVMGKLQGKEFPCQLCGAGIPILPSKVNKPYFTCNSCGVQTFVRGKVGIARLISMANAGILVSVKTESSSQGINLLNQLERLKLQKEELTEKSGIIFKNKNVENVIRVVDAEIEKVQGEIARMAIATESDTNT
jgi:hypothetical protein